MIADDHTLVRQEVKKLLETDPELQMVGESQDGEETVEIAIQLLPDLIIMDISMPGLNGLEATRQI